MRKYSTVIAITLALALAAIIVVASTWVPGASSDRPDADASALPPGHPNVALSPRSGTVDVEEAARRIPALERAHEANPGSVRILLNLGDAYYAAQRFEEAATAYGKALEASPGHPSATVRMAMVWHARGDDERAIGLIQGVLADLPDQQEAQYNLAIILFSRQEVDAAKAAWARAAEIDPTSKIGVASQNFVDLLSDGDESSAGP